MGAGARWGGPYESGDDGMLELAVRRRWGAWWKGFMGIRSVLDDVGGVGRPLGVGVGGREGLLRCEIGTQD
jgi:hypothetical protein